MDQDQQLRDVMLLVRELERIGEIRDKGIKREFQNIHERTDRLEEHVDARFDAVDARFITMKHSVDARFDAVDAGSTVWTADWKTLKSTWAL